MLFLFGSLIINTFFGTQFSPTITLLLPLSIAGFFAGMYQPYNLFLSVKMKGKWLRNMSFIMSVVSIVGCILIIPKFGAFGAAVVNICANGTFFLTCLFYYNRYLQEVSNGS
jgi:O-antigen/teichoic acid export membrane protein